MSPLYRLVQQHRFDTLEAARSGLHEDRATVDAIKALMLELIGEDEHYGPRLWKPARNEFRAELRRKVEDL